MPNTNVVSERLDRLHDQWVAFAEDPLARLLVWRVMPDETAMIDAFVARESEPDAAQTPDLFLELTTPFDSPTRHGRALADELCAQCAEASDGVGPEDPLGWRPPRVAAQGDDVAALLRLLASFRSHHFSEGDPAKVVLWLSPTEVSSASEYLRWVHRLVQQAPGELRAIVLDDISEPVFHALAKVETERVVETTCSLDMPAALQAVAASAGTGSPGGKFRLLQTQLGAALAAGDLQAALRHGSAASALATEQGWPHFAAFVQMMLAVGFGMHERPLEALKAYAEAERLGSERETQEAKNESPESAAPFGRRIRLQARLGQGAVLLGTHAYKHAGETYAIAAQIANSLSDPRSELDCYRLASVSYAEHGDARLAWELGARAFQLGLTMDEETRKTSTLLYLADHLLRMTKRHDEFAAHGKPLEAQLTKLLGPNWRDQLVVAKAA